MLLEKFLGDLREERVAQNVLVSRIEETFVDELGFELVESFSLGALNRAVVNNLVDGHGRLAALQVACEIINACRR